jgi:hypothetical protein
MGLDLGIGDGKSASQISRDIRTYLNQPDMLFRRVRDKYGNLQLSQHAKAYNPGQGVYRSSYKNAMRLAVTETNMAYNVSDFERWKNLDFVCGVEVRLSGNHPVTDICNELAGKYPKGFMFRGWHSHCRCHSLPIQESESEFVRRQKSLLSGTNYDTESSNKITDLPSNFKDWVDNNSERIQSAKSLPYFLKDNDKMIGK